jgi:hypothetical protein
VGTNVSEGHIASIIRAEVWIVFFSPEDGGSQNYLHIFLSPQWHFIDEAYSQVSTVEIIIHIKI